MEVEADIGTGPEEGRGDTEIAGTGSDIEQTFITIVPPLTRLHNDARTSKKASIVK